MKSNYFDNSSQLIKENGCVRCAGVPNEEKLINNNELNCVCVVTLNKNQGVPSVPKYNGTPDTPCKSQGCDNYLEENLNKNNMLNFLAHPIHLAHQKNINTCNQSPKELEKTDTEQLKIFLGEDWDDYKDDPEALESWSNLLAENHLIDQGEIPPTFTAITYCIACGDVFIPPSLVNAGKVLGCPWCWNRTKGLPIPKSNNLSS